MNAAHSNAAIEGTRATPPLPVPPPGTVLETADGTTVVYVVGDDDDRGDQQRIRQLSVRLRSGSSIVLVGVAARHAKVVIGNAWTESTPEPRSRQPRPCHRPRLRCGAARAANHDRRRVWPPPELGHRHPRAPAPAYTTAEAPNCRTSRGSRRPCESSLKTLAAAAPTTPGSCTQGAWVSDNPGYNPEATPVKRLKKVQFSVGPAC